MEIILVRVANNGNHLTLCGVVSDPYHTRVVQRGKTIVLCCVVHTPNGGGAWGIKTMESAKGNINPVGRVY